MTTLTMSAKAAAQAARAWRVEIRHRNDNPTLKCKYREADDE